MWVRATLWLILTDGKRKKKHFPKKISFCHRSFKSKNIFEKHSKLFCIQVRIQTYVCYQKKHTFIIVGSWCGQVAACSTSTPTIQARIPLKPTVFSVKFVFEKNENKQKKRPGLAHFFKNILLMDSDCGTVGRAFDTDTRESGLESAISNLIYFQMYWIDEKRPGRTQIKINLSVGFINVLSNGNCPIEIIFLNKK